MLGVAIGVLEEGSIGGSERSGQILGGFEQELCFIYSKKKASFI